MDSPSPKVLIVDDSFGVSTAIAMMLEEDGFTVEIAEHYHRGLRLALNGQFQLLIIDVKLGTESGLDLAVEIMRNGIRCKIILVSGLVDLSTEFAEHPELKQTPVLLKPFGRELLLDCVHQTLNEAAA